MPNLSDFAEGYAHKLSEAIQQDQAARSVGYIKKAMDYARASHLAAVLKEIGSEIEGLVYEATGLPLSEEDKQQIAEAIARRLGWDQPRTLRRLIKGGSVDSLMTMTTEMESLFQAVRK